MDTTIERSYTTATTLAAGTFTSADVGRLFKNKTDGEIWRCVSTAPKFAHAYSLKNAEYTITYAASITPNCLNGLNQVCTLTGALALAVPTANVTVGTRIRIRLIQGSGGTKVITFAAGWHFPGGDPTESTTAGRVDVLEGVWNGTVWNATLTVNSATS